MNEYGTIPDRTRTSPAAERKLAERKLVVHWYAVRIAVTTGGLLVALLFSSLIVSLLAEEAEKSARAKQPASPPGLNLKATPVDLRVPPVEDARPAPGKRVKQQLPAFEGSKLFHVVALPTNWTPDRRWPVLVEYPGNGPYENKLGDTNSGLVEDCNLAYGLSGGADYICLTLPFVDPAKKEHQRQWWGDAQATADYCLAAVEQICRDWGGDPGKLVLCGFSRGAIACNYIGLRDDKIARLWNCFVVHSHYDGVRRWNYADSDAKSAQARLARLQGRPQWISHETSVEATEQYLATAQKQSDQPLGQFTFTSLPFANHTDTWVLRDVEPRREVRAWLRKQLQR
jgi:hypothetical protein